MRLIWFLLRASRTDVIIAVLAGIVGGASASGFALVLQNAIAARGANVGWHAALFAGCWIGYGLGAAIAANRITRVAQRAIRELRLSLSRQLLALPLGTLEHEGRRIFPVLTEDIHAISGAAEDLPSVVTGFVTVVGCFVILASISWPLTAIFLALIGLAAGGHFLPFYYFQQHFNRWRAEWDRVSALIDALARGHKELLLDARKHRSFFSKHLEPVCRRQEAEMVPANTWDTVLRRLGEMILLLGLGVLLFTLPQTGIATFEQFGRFLFVALFALAPLGTITGYLTRVARADTAVNRAGELGLLLAGAAAPAYAAVVPSRTLRFGLRDAVFRHPRADGAPFQLGPVTVEFDRPEIVFVRGGNGSGKTTLLKLLCGLYTPTQGELLDHTVAVPTSALAAHRQRFAAVFSDFHLFDSLLGYEDSDPERAAELLRQMGLEGQVAIAADGAFSRTDLSQGQRKRLALIAALLEDKAIYIFDEWAADQDPEFRRVFYDRFLPDLRARGRLVIAITHDELYFDRADRLLHLVEGRIESDCRQVSRAATSHGG